VFVLCERSVRVLSVCVLCGCVCEFCVLYECVCACEFECVYRVCLVSVCFMCVMSARNVCCGVVFYFFWAYSLCGVLLCVCFFV